jgi:hypothetical protein
VLFSDEEQTILGANRLSSCSPAFQRQNWFTFGGHSFIFKDHKYLENVWIYKFIEYIINDFYKLLVIFISVKKVHFRRYSDIPKFSLVMEALVRYQSTSIRKPLWSESSDYIINEVFVQMRFIKRREIFFSTFLWQQR